jgi:hypothetical protein
MPRKKASQAPAAPADQARAPDPAAPRGRRHVIDPNAVYDLPTAARCLGLKPNCLPREVRLGRLRASKRGRRYFVLGRWLLEWFEAGEVHRETRPALAGATGRNGEHGG